MIQIITDSAADFEPHELKQLGITCIPLTVMFGDMEYQENVNLSKNEFYAKLLASNQSAKTAQASPQILIDLFETSHQQGDKAIYITLSSGLSGTYQSACMVQSSLGYETCHVIDSKNGTGGQRILVEHAVKLRDAGKSAAEILAGIEDVRSRIVLYACMDTMKYLYQGGRISHTAYKLGTLAHIKPIISVDSNGYVQVPAKAMGMRKGMDLMCKYPELQDRDPDFPLYVMYTNNRTTGETLASRLATVGHTVPEEHIIPVGAAIGSHIGPNACGLVYVRNHT